MKVLFFAIIKNKEKEIRYDDDFKEYIHNIY